jgi:hypothetical protein
MIELGDSELLIPNAIAAYNPKPILSIIHVQSLCLRSFFMLSFSAQVTNFMEVYPQKF